MADDRPQHPGVPDQLRDAYLTALRAWGGDPSVAGVDVGADPRAGASPATGATAWTVRVHLRDAPPTAAETAGALPFRENVRVAFLRADYTRRTGARSVLQRWIDVSHSVLSSLTRDRAPARTIRPGMPVAHRLRSNGTLGLIAHDHDRQRVLISSFHTLVARSRADSPRDVMIQLPGGDRIRIARQIDGFDDLDGDAAMARLELPDGWSADAAQQTSGVTVRSVASAALAATVEKSGATSGVTSGTIDGIGRYFIDASQPTGFDGFRIVPPAHSPADFCAPGDSGALWYDRIANAAVGLHVGEDLSMADPRRRPAIACHMERVFSRLRLSI